MTLIHKYRNIVIGLISLTLIVISFNSALSNVVLGWNAEEYSYGYFIPFIAVFIGWHRLVKDKPILRPSWLGVGCLLAAGLLQLTASLSAFGIIAQYGFVLALVGLSLAFLGRTATRSVAP